MREFEVVSKLLADPNARLEPRSSSPDPQIIESLVADLRNARNVFSLRIKDIPGIQISYPPFYMENPLSQQQRTLVDNLLAPLYASGSVSLQERVAQIPISESYERMVYLPGYFQKQGLPVSFSSLPFSEACGEWAGKSRVFWVRHSFAERLGLAAEALKVLGLFMHFEDAFRPVGVQEGLFRRRIGWILKEHPEWDGQTVLTEAKSKTAVTPRLASHKSGAAADITLRRMSDSSFLDLGNKYPEGGALVALDCPFITQEQWITRQIFSNVFRMAGCTLYPFEDWHVSFGDNLAGIVNNEPLEGYESRFGPLKNFSLDTGEIKEVYSPLEYDQTFLSEDLKNLIDKKV